MVQKVSKATTKSNKKRKRGEKKNVVNPKRSACGANPFDYGES